MPGVPHPGVSEQGWLADLKETAEQVGGHVFGEALKWDVEGLVPGTGRRPDVVIRRDADNSIVASGEAKRPDTSLGAHPLVATEVRDAIEKAQMRGADLCFTTNFIEMAVFDARDRPYATDLDRLQGGLIPLVDQAAATTQDWWLVLPAAERTQLTILGLRQLFERLHQSSREPVARNINEITLHFFSRTTDRLLQPLFETFLAKREAGQIPDALVTRAFQVALNPTEDGDARFLVAQGIAEVLTATLFYRNICDHFSLGTLLAGTRPATAKAMIARLNGSLRYAIRESGDYDTIFDLSAAANWVLTNGGTGVLQHWKNLFDFVEQLDFTSVSSDVIGSIFERLISPERRHAMGQHYTDSRVTQSMSRWAVQTPDDHVADVACGAGTFLVEVWKRLAAFGLPHATILNQVIGNDLDPFAVHLATVNMATRDIYRGANYPAVRLGDAFDIQPGCQIIAITPAAGPPVEIAWPASGVDAVVGNPPYSVRAENETELRTSLIRLGAPAPQAMAGNLAAWFALLAAALIKGDGRWALVLPTAVLQNTNLVPWRRWLRSNFDIIVWHDEHDVWFSDARVATCVILATRATANRALHYVDLHERIQGELVDVNGVPSPSVRASVRDLSTLAPEGDILIAGTYPDLLRSFEQSERVAQLGSMAEIQVFSGNKLGHAMYQLRDVAPTRAGVLRDVEGFGMKVRLNRSYLLPILRSPMDERTGEFTKSDYWVLNAPESLPSGGQIRNYVSHCRALGAHTAPSVSQRGPRWWHVAWRTSQVAVQIHPGFLHQVWWSPDPFVAKNNFHVLEFAQSTPQGDRELVAASLASAFGALAALYLSSEVGCEGVRWLSTEQLLMWPALNPANVSRGDRDAVLRGYRLFRQLRAEEIHHMDPATLAAWEELTAAVATAAGLAQPDRVSAAVIEFARGTCVRRAERETLALAGRPRSGVRRGTFARHIQGRLEASPRTGALLDGLTSGPRVIRLRPAAYLAQTAFDFGGEDDAMIATEEALSLVLGDGFECAPALSADDPEGLAAEIRALLDDLTLALVGPIRSGGQANATHREIAAEVRRAAIDWLQGQVRNRLL